MSEITMTERDRAMGGGRTAEEDGMSDVTHHIGTLRNGTEVFWNGPGYSLESEEGPAEVTPRGADGTPEAATLRDALLKAAEAWPATDDWAPGDAPSDQ